MKLLTIIALSLCAIAASAQSPKELTKLHAATYRTHQEIISGGAGCSATAIGAHALLTATHCELPTDKIELSGIDDPITITGRIRDSYDHTIYLVDYTFDKYVSITLDDKYEQGENIFYFGNPASMSDLFRKGYVIGRDSDDSSLILSDDKNKDKKDMTGVVLDVNGFFGDSGSGIFNESGKVISVMSYVVMFEHNGVSVKFQAVYPFAFTKADLEKIK